MKVLEDRDGVVHRAVMHREMPAGSVFFTALCDDITAVTEFRPKDSDEMMCGPMFSPRWNSVDVYIGVPTCVRCLSDG